MEVRGHGIVPTGFRIDSIGFGSILSVWLDSIGVRLDSIGLARFSHLEFSCPKIIE